MTEEMRAKKNFVADLLRDISNWRYDASAKVKADLKKAEPLEVKTSRKIVKRWDEMVQRKCDAASKRHSKRLVPVREALAFGRYEEALRLLKRIKNP